MTTITGASGGVTAKNITDSPISIQNGLSEEALLKLLEKREQFLELTEKHTITDAALTAFFATIRIEKVPPEKLVETMIDIAKRYVEQMDRLSTLESDDPEIGVLIEKARKALEDGDTKNGERLLKEAEEKEALAAEQAMKLAEDAKQAAGKRAMAAARLAVEQGESAITRLAYKVAADHFDRALTRALADEEGFRFYMRDRRANALFRHGERHGERESLLTAIELGKTNLSERPKDSYPKPRTIWETS